MPQAIKQYTGLWGDGMTTSTGTVYTCPSNTIAIVLPNVLFCPNAYGASGALGFNSSSYPEGDHNNTPIGNYVIRTGQAGYQYQITHDNKYGVKIAAGPQNDQGTQLWYSPNFTTNLNNENYAMRAVNGYASSSLITYAGLVAGDGMYHGPSVNYTHTPNDFWAGTWAMSAGHRLTLSTNYQMRIQYSFLILEEAA